MNFITRLLRQDEGVTAIEYALIAALIAVLLIGVLQALGGQLQTTFTAIQNALSGAGGGGG